MKNQTNKKEWINHKGEVVPEKYVSGYDKKKEKILKMILKEAELASEKLTVLKKIMFSKGDALNDLMYTEHRMDKPETKGNYTAYTFDKSIRLTMKIADIVEFDERVKLAQEKINEFLKSKSEGADSDLMELVNSAFKTTKGRLDKNRVLGLFSLKITNKIWLEAMELIKLSISTNHTRRYASIAVRDENGDYKDIQLNITSI